MNIRLSLKLSIHFVNGVYFLLPGGHLVVGAVESPVFDELPLFPEEFGSVRLREFTIDEFEKIV